MRIAFVRGPNLNAWELQNFALVDEDLVAFGSRAGQFEVAMRGLDVPVRELPSLRDAFSRLPPIVRAAVERFGGPTDYLFGLERAVRGFDIAHVADFINPYTGQAVAARDRGAVKRVVMTAWENIPYREPENALVARRVARVAAGVDHCIAITERAKLHLEVAGVPSERITVQPMGIDLERFTAPDGAGERDEDRPLEILCVSRLVHEKGIEDVVVAVGLLRRQGVRARLRLLGRGPLEARLPELARRMGVAEDVELAGSVSYGEIPAAYRAADVFVLASAPRTTWREQFGFAIVEAMASGLPVIAGDSGSLSEVVADRDSLVVPHEPQALAAHLAALAADPAERRRQGARNRAWAEERYDRRRVAAAVHRVYQQVLDDPPRPRP